MGALNPLVYNTSEIVYSTDYDKIGRNSTNISPSVTGQVFYENRFVEENSHANTGMDRKK